MVLILLFRFAICFLISTISGKSRNSPSGVIILKMSFSVSEKSGNCSTFSVKTFKFNSV